MIFLSGRFIFKYKINVFFTQKNYVNISRNSVPVLFDGLIKGNRASLAQSITLIETTSEKKKILAQELLDKVLNNLRSRKSSTSFRIGKFRSFKSRAVFVLIQFLNIFYF
jgi:hypothetical protein